MRHVLTPALISLMLVGCSPAPDQMSVSASVENPSTLEALSVTFMVDRAPRDFNLEVRRTGAADQTVAERDLEVNDDRTAFTITIPARETARDQVWTFEGIASYGGDNEVRATHQITIGNTAPAAMVSMDPERPTTLDDVHAIVDIDDPDDNTVQVTYEWTLNDEVSFITGKTFPSRATRRDDVLKLTVTVRDSKSEAEPAVVQTVIENIEPGPAEIAILPDPAEAGAPLNCVVTEPAIDPDGDEVSYLFEWLRNDRAWEGEVIATVRDGDTIPPLTTNAGELWSCRATPTDGSKDGPLATANMEIIPWAGPRVFSTCGATGNTGPDQAGCDEVYAGELIDGEVEVVDGIQIWRAPTTGRFRIYAGGSIGGMGEPSYRDSPGNGAVVEGTFDLQYGEELHIIVGQAGKGNDYQSGGGGGGTFVVKDGTEPMIIAGGGGGTSRYTYGDTCDGLAGESGGRGSGTSWYGNCAAISGGAGQGGGLSANSRGAGGGGFETDGTDDYPGYSRGEGGKAFVNGGEGGTDGTYPCGSPAPGGFGGGGSGNGCYGGGGGGGYSGGQGGYIGGGGGSFNAGDEPVAEAGGNDDVGWVIIDLE